MPALELPNFASGAFFDTFKSPATTIVCPTQASFLKLSKPAKA
jgi:hypothetical protein